tara:strand:- start:141 stop:410 length:270 start_codon:yes stop_codon:yes gene_type:complete
MTKVELFLEGLQSEIVKSKGLKVEKHWTGNVMFSFPQEPEVLFRGVLDEKLNKDGSLDIMWLDKRGFTKTGVKTFPKEFIDTIISTIKK